MKRSPRTSQRLQTRPRPLHLTASPCRLKLSFSIMAFIRELSILPSTSHRRYGTSSSNLLTAPSSNTFVKFSGRFAAAAPMPRLSLSTISALNSCRRPSIKCLLLACINTNTARRHRWLANDPALQSVGGAAHSTNGRRTTWRTGNACTTRALRSRQTQVPRGRSRQTQKRIPGPAAVETVSSVAAAEQCTQPKRSARMGRSVLLRMLGWTTKKSNVMGPLHPDRRNRQTSCCRMLSNHI